ncbi:heparinase II/III family protein [Streptomyces sp. NPDC049879]|uniref:heparinase II/III domain-containing protein n=1 Tax=Streptomyces sp. NPDC049879 TaxID=3365598 RepID=UPI0037A70AC8
MPQRFLTDLHSPTRLAASLPAPGTWRPLPQAADRAAWGGLPDAEHARLREAAHRELARPWAGLPPDGFTAYGTTGDRETYEVAYFARRTRLIAAVLLTVLDGPGSAAAVLDEGVRLLCEERTWCLPAHELSHDADGIPAPDPGRPTVDLFAADTAALLAFTDLVAGEELGPRRRADLGEAVRERVLRPFRERDDWWWLGLHGEELNNWTTWILSNVLPASLLLDTAPQDMLATATRTVAALDRYVECAPADGGCDEGIAYWWRSAASYFECLEHLSSATGEDAPLRHPLTAAMARYPLATHIGGDWYVNFADGRPLLPQVEPGLLHRFGARTGEPEVCAHAAAMPPAAGLASPDVSLARLLTPLLDTAWQRARTTPGAPPLTARTWLPDTGVLTARTRPGEERGLFLAAKAGHNGEFHNHNDTGSFIVALDGRPVVIDLGVGTYSKETFGPDRYRIWTMRSSWHNLPLVGGHEQATGHEHAARDVSARLDGSGSSLTMDLAPAWNAAAGLLAWRRTCTLETARVTVDDTWRLAAAPTALALHLVTTGPVTAGNTPGTLLLGPPAHRLLLHYDAGDFDAETDEQPVTDPKLAAVWGTAVHRIRLTARTPAATGHSTLALTPAPDAAHD